MCTIWIPPGGHIFTSIMVLQLCRSLHFCFVASVESVECLFQQDAYFSYSSVLESSNCAVYHRVCVVVSIMFLKAFIMPSCSFRFWWCELSSVSLEAPGLVEFVEHVFDAEYGTKHSY